MGILKGVENMFKTLGIVILAILGFGVGIGNASLSMGVTMNSGTDVFHDGISASGNVQIQGIYTMGSDGLLGQSLAQIGPRCASFSEDTWTSFSKSGGPSDDPYMDINKDVSNTGSGIAYSTMQFSDSGYWSPTHSINLVSGLQTDDKINSAYLNSYFTNYVDMTGSGSAAWTAENTQALAGFKFDRQTGNLVVTPLQISVSLTPFDVPSGFPLF